MRKQIVNKFRSFLMLCALFIGALALTGCSSLSYVGDDYNPINAAPVQTNEQFYFSTYNKTSATENIQMRVGVAKTQVKDILATYIQIKNESDTNDYVFYVKDFTISAGDNIAQMVPASAYLGAYQTAQAGMLASMSQSSSGFSSFANVANTYQRLNQTNPQAETANVSSDEGALKQISNVVEGISEHTINNAAVIKPNENKFFYVFAKDLGTYPVTIKYKDLTYNFMLKGKNPSFDEED